MADYAPMAADEHQLVQLKDGTTVKFPKNPTEADWKVLEELEGTSKEQSFVGKAKDWLTENTPDSVKNAGSSVVKGITALPSLVLEATDAITPVSIKDKFRASAISDKQAQLKKPNDPLAEWLFGEGYGAQQKEKIKASLQELQQGKARPSLSQIVGKDLYQPKTTAEKYIDQGIQGAVSGGRNYIVGALAGLGGEAGGQMSRTEADPDGSPIARIIGSLATGGGAALLNTMGGTKADLAKKLVETLLPDDVQKSAAAMRTGAKEGLPLTLNNSLPDNADLASMAKYLASHETGKNVKRTISNQPANVRGGTAERIANLPGQAKSGLLTANDLKSEVTDAFQALKQERSALVDPLYAQAGDLGQVTTENISKKIKELLKQPGLDIDAGTKLKMLDAELTASSLNGKPRTHALDIKAAIDDLANNSALQGQNPLAPKTTGALKNAKKELFAELERNATNLGDDSLTQANAAYSQFTKDKINPFKESISGKILGPQGAIEGKNASEGTARALFKSEDPNALGSDILTLNKDLAKTAPTAITDVFKTHLSKTMADIPADANPATFLRDKLWGSAGNRAATERGLQVMEESQNLPAGTLSVGFKRWLSLVDKVAKSDVKEVGKTIGELEVTGQANSLSRGLGLMTIAPLAGPRDSVNKLYLHSALRDIDKLFVEPEGLQMLVELSKKATTDKVARGMVATMLNTGREARKLKEDQDALEQAKRDAAAIAAAQQE